MDGILDGGLLFWALPIVTWALLFFIAFALFEMKNQVRDLRLTVHYMAEDQEKLIRYLATTIEPPSNEPEPEKGPPSLAEQVRQVRGG